MASQRKAPKLSKALLDLKFMKRSKIRMENEKAAEESASLFEKDITEEMKSGMGKFIMVDSYVPMENLKSGRVSFRGMNPDVEKLMAQELLKDPNRGQMPADISDQQMAAISLTVAKKFNKKRKNSKFKFMKPGSDSD